MYMKKTIGIFIIVLGTVSLATALLTSVRAEAGQRYEKKSTLSTAPLAIQEFGVMECTVVNLSNRDIEVKISQLYHFRQNPSLPNDPWVQSEITRLAPGQATSFSGTVGSDPAIGRCTFEFKGKKNKVRAAAVLLEDVIYGGGTLQYGKTIAAIEAR
jgi:hypothetical protein